MKIIAHHDADGITSAYFAQFGFGESEIVFPHKFGDTTKFEKGDVMVDMRPDNPNIEGLVIDHHFPHPDKKDRKYKLIPDISKKEFQYSRDIVPASLLCWNEYKDKIPKNEWWKLAIGLAGDGQLELMPTEVFKECPSLLKPVKTSAYQSYGNWKISMYPLYKLLSSPINAFLRKEEYESALNLIKYSDSPYTLYSSEDARIAKNDIKNEFQTAVKDSEIFDYGSLQVIVYYSKYRMSGYIASALQNSMHDKTLMAINKRDGSLSVRGDLATYYKDTLGELDYIEIDGHAGFMGGKLTKNYNKLIADLDELV